jgi:hypothetical protein
MQKYLVLFCRYDPDNYHGYYRHEFEAFDFTSAEETARKHIDRTMFHLTGDIEYQVYKISDQSHGRLWNVSEQVHR